MKRYFFVFIYVFYFASGSHAQLADSTKDLPVIISATISKDSSKPLIIYLCGDGGWNKFSMQFSKVLSSKGYPLICLNSLKYFWKKKTSEKAGADVSRLIKMYLQKWQKKDAILIGYSFGADAIPFVYTHLSGDTKELIRKIVLISPSAKTDLEIHISGMFGGKSSGKSVPEEINKITGIPVLITLSNDDNGFPKNKLTRPNIVFIKLKGDHHYDGNVTGLCDSIASKL